MSGEDMFQGMHYVYEVYREMSFSRAAKKLFISQPSLSNAVRKTEQRLGAPLFDRSTNPIGLTDLGREYIRAVELILEVENGFATYVHDRNALQNGAVSIGGTNVFTSYALPPLVSQFTEQFPQIHIELVEAVTSELKERLSDGSLDLLIDNTELNAAAYEKKFFREEHLLLTVPKALAVNERVRNYALTAEDIKRNAHLNSRIPPVPLQEFREERFLLLREGNDTRERADRLCHEAGFSPKLRLEPEQQVTAYNFSCYGMGISFNGDVLIKHVPDDTNLCFYKLNAREAVREVNFYFRRNRYMSRAVREFLKLV